MTENRRALKEMQRKNMEKDAMEKEKTSRGLKKMKQFQGVQSKVGWGVLREGGGGGWQGGRYSFSVLTPLSILPHPPSHPTD